MPLKVSSLSTNLTYQRALNSSEIVRLCGVSRQEKMGHDHIPKVPSPDIYKVENVPELMRVRERLAEKGLKDPWLRNEVWRYYQNEPIAWKRHLKVATRGMRLGIPAFLITIAIEKYFGIDYGHGHHENHNDGGHH